MSDDRRKRGEAAINKLMGGTDSGAKLAAMLPPKLAAHTLDFVFGDLWAGDDLTMQERSMVTCTALISMNRPNELKAHFQGAKNLGIPREKIEAIITHLAAYAGWPSAMTANGILNEIWPKG